MSALEVGPLLKGWRERRRISQLELASSAGVSARHLSFVETGRARPTSAMILRLSAQLEVPLRAQNQLLLAGGFAPAYDEQPVASLSVVNDAIEQILAAHAPFPALVVDHGWDLVAANDAVFTLAGLASAHLLEPPINVIRLTLHPDGLAPYILNLGQWRAHLVERVGSDLAASGDTRLADLLDEIGGYPGAEGESSGGIVVPLRLRVGEDELSMFSTTTVFGTPREVTVSELAIESFYPLDAATRAWFTG